MQSEHCITTRRMWMHAQFTAMWKLASHEATHYNYNYWWLPVWSYESMPLTHWWPVCCSADSEEEVGGKKKRVVSSGSESDEEKQNSGYDIVINHQFCDLFKL